MVSKDDMPQQSFAKAVQQAGLKVDRANRHILEAQGIIQRFVDDGQCRIVSDRNAETGAHLFKAEADPVPSDLLCAIGDAFNNLNSALDYLASGIMYETKSATGRTTSPMHETRQALDQSFSEAHGTKEAGSHRPMLESAPLFVDLLLNQIKPYKGGGMLIWEVRYLSNTDKHRLIVPTVRVASIHDVNISDSNDNKVKIGKIDVSPGGYLNLSSHSANKAKIDHYGHTALVVTFPDSLKVFSGDPVIPTMLQCAQAVREVIKLCDLTLGNLWAA